MREEARLESHHGVEHEREERERVRDDRADRVRALREEHGGDRRSGRDRQQRGDDDAAREDDADDPLRGAGVDRVILRRLIGIQTQVVDDCE